MALKDKWIDKVNGVDINSADDINQVARAVIELEEKESGGITNETDPTVPSWAKEKQKPTYTASEVGALPANTKIPSNTSDLNNDSGFITRLVPDLENYYTKSQTYTQEEIRALISAIPKFSISVVSSLPTANISTTTIYLVGGGTESDLYTEYIYANGKWEILGAQRVDLTGYATQTWVNTQLSSYLKSSKLDSAINDALAEAKESGEFDGADGKDYVLTEADKAEIATLVDPTASVPGYWIEELETKADAIQRAMETAGRNKSAFLWYTDAHWQSNSQMSPTLLKYLVKNTPMNKVNFGGDIVSDPSAFTHENIKYVYEWRNLIADLPNHHSVYGNHDVNHRNSNGMDGTNKIAYALLLAPEETPDMVIGGDSYYYVDNPAEKTRYLYLSYTTRGIGLIELESKFIVDALSSVKDGWHVVAISHRWWNYSSSSNPTVGSVSEYEAEVLKVFDVYNARTTRSATTFFEAVDFTNAKGKVEFCIGGHIHIDYDFYSNGGIPVIITAADTNQERVGNNTTDSGTLGTITESAVFGIVADYNEDVVKVTVIGVGRGTSRVVRGSSAKPVSITSITYDGDTTVGNTIDKSKFNFVVNYSDGTTSSVTGATSVTPTTISVVGNNSVTVSYTEGGTTVSASVDIVGTPVPIVNLLNLDRSYVSGATSGSIGAVLDETKAYLNYNYGSDTFASKSCTASNISEDSVTVTEAGAGGVCVAYPIHLTDIQTQSYRLTFDYSGTGKCRTYYKYAKADGTVSNKRDIFINDTSGASGTTDAQISAVGSAGSGFEWLIILFGSNTSGTKSFANIMLTKAT